MFQGKDAVPFLEKLVVGDIQGIENGSGTLSVFTNEKGGIIDDSVITKACHNIFDKEKSSLLAPLMILI